MTRKTGLCFYSSLAILLSGLYSCVSWGPIISGYTPFETGTSTGNGIIGKLYQPCGKLPARGDSVFLRPRNYLPEIRVFPKHSSTLPTIIVATCTDESGNYRFQSIPKGLYICEARDLANNRVMIDSVNIDPSCSTAMFFVDTLKPSSIISGKLSLENDSEQVYFQVFGLDIYAIADANGVFSLKNIPAGNIRIRISIFRGSGAEFDTNSINIKPGAVITMDSCALLYETIAYDGNGNTGGKIPLDTKRYKIGQKAQVLGNTGSLEKTGWVFAGWNTRQDGSGARYNPGDSIVVSSRMLTLFAMWVSIGAILDIDGNGYSSVKIGTQTWMAENLKTTRYNDGDTIALVTDKIEWGKRVSGAYCWYKNDTANKAAYGALYNWYAVNTGKLAPKGWHVATDADWRTLIAYCGGDNFAGAKLKTADGRYWNPPDTVSNNASGFSAFPGGCRLLTQEDISGTYEIVGVFGNLGFLGEWWASTEYNVQDAWFLIVVDNAFYVEYNAQTNNKGFGLSVRCVRDAMVN